MRAEHIVSTGTSGSYTTAYLREEYYKGVNFTSKINSGVLRRATFELRSSAYKAYDMRIYYKVYTGSFSPPRMDWSNKKDWLGMDHTSKANNSTAEYWIVAINGESVFTGNYQSGSGDYYDFTFGTFTIPTDARSLNLAASN